MDSHFMIHKIFSSSQYAISCLSRRILPINCFHILSILEAWKLTFNLGNKGATVNRDSKKKASLTSLPIAQQSVVKTYPHMEARQESQVHGCACGCEMYFTANEVDIRLLLQTMSQPQNTTEENLRAEQPEEINAKEMVGLIHQKNDVNNQLPKYDGLEGWVLIEKIGNGATSDVYRAKNIEGTLEVAIKIVRKLDMKFKQVSSYYMYLEYLLLCVNRHEIIKRYPS